MSGACGDKVGTRAGFRRHGRANEQSCEPCRVARRDYESEHKRRARAAGRVTPQSAHTVAQHRRYIAARGRALSRLAEVHPEQMARLLADELGPDDIVVRQPWKWRAA